MLARELKKAWDTLVLDALPLIEARIELVVLTLKGQGSRTVKERSKMVRFADET